MKTLATYNIKGGVGKTAAAVNLAYLAAREGAQTLVWDLDPQGAATFYFRVKPKVKGGGKALVRRKRSVLEAIKGTDYDNLDLLPADFSYRHMDLELDRVKKPTHRLAKIATPLVDEYDYLFLDCAPGMSLVSENVLEAVDALLVPLIPTTLSLRTLEQLLAFIAKHGPSSLAVLPFFSMVDRRKRLHQDIMNAADGEHPSVLQARIPYASDVERMGVQRAALGSYSAASASARAFEDLWGEIKRRLATR
jgi:cellulose biosynthesis protein BcsQ